MSIILFNKNISCKDISDMRAFGFLIEIILTNVLTKKIEIYNITPIQRLDVSG